MKEIVNMSEKEAYEVIRKILCGQDEKQELPYLEPDSHIKKDLGLDSFQLVEMIGELEDKLDICIPDRKLRELQTVGQVVRFIREQT